MPSSNREVKMRVTSVPLALVALLLAASAVLGQQQQTTPWCQSETIEPFSSALGYLGLAPDVEVVGEVEVQKIITDAFLRVKCDDQDLGGKTCDNCLLAENVFDLLGVTVSDGLDEDHLMMASTLILHFMHQLPALCPTVDSVVWEDMDYHDVVHEFMEIHVHDHVDNADEEEHEDTFNTHQLNSLVMEINETYRPGDGLLEDGSGGWLDPPMDVCDWANITHFRSGDVYKRAAVDHPEEGVTEEELAHMNSILLFHFLRGDCVREDLRVDSEVPEPDDFIVSLFEEFADNVTCLIFEEGFESLLSHLGFEGDHDHDDAHDHSEPDNHEEDDDHDHGVGIPDPAHMCMGDVELLAVFGLNASDGLSREDIELISPMLVQQVAQGCGHVDDTTERTKPGSGAVWGYSIISVLIISAFAPLGLLITRWEHADIYKYIMALMLGLGVGALVGDALLHLIPLALDVHAHGAGDEHDHEDGEEEDMSFVWKMFVCCLGIWAFFVLQLLLQYAHGGKTSAKVGSESSLSLEVTGSKTSMKEAHENPAMVGSVEDVSAPGLPVKASVTDLESNPAPKAHVGGHGHSHDTDVYADSALGWMVAVGDSFHNFADGMAIGASYAVDINLGISTSIAIFFHEIPHEFGDVAVMLSTGWSCRRVFVMQILTQSTAMLGVFIGIPVAQIDGATQWILALAAGLFLYVALSNVIPELVQYFKAYEPWRVFFWANLGIGLGFLVMLIIALFEDVISI